MCSQHVGHSFESCKYTGDDSWTFSCIPNDLLTFFQPTGFSLAMFLQSIWQSVSDGGVWMIHTVMYNLHKWEQVEHLIEGQEQCNELLSNGLWKEGARKREREKKTYEVWSQSSLTGVKILWIWKCTCGGMNQSKHRTLGGLGTKCFLKIMSHPE